MKKIFKNWSWFEIVFLFLSLLVVVVCFALGEEKNALTLTSSVLGIITVVFTAKGLFFAPIVNIVYLIFYSIVSFLQKYYGEVILSVCWTLPICICALVSWLRNRNKNNPDIVRVNKIRFKEFATVVLSTLVAGVGLYFLLRAINTSQLLISSCAIVLSINGAYFSFRRCKFYAVFYILSDSILIAMWAIVVAGSGVGYLPMLVNFCVFLLNDFYALFHWCRQAKKQASE